MSQENKGAPSSDTTSALFVSARKKQLEQQEAERRAKEKEDQRLAAEAEVRRLEQEVEERKRKAEEDARRVEAEAQEEARRVAEQARARNAAAAADPDSVLGAAQPAVKQSPVMPKIPQMGAAMPKQSGVSIPKPQGGVAVADGKILGMDKKIFIIAAGGAAVVVIGIILAIVLLGGGGSDGGTSSKNIDYSSTRNDITFSYPDDWTVADESGGFVSIINEKLDAKIAFFDATGTMDMLTNGGYALGDASNEYLTEFANSMTAGMPASEIYPASAEGDGTVEGEVNFTYTNADDKVLDVRLKLITVGGNFIMSQRTLPNDKAKNAEKVDDIVYEIMTTVAITGDSAAEQSGSTDSKAIAVPPAGYARYNSGNGFTLVYPKDWSASDANNPIGITSDIKKTDGSTFINVFNYREQGAGMTAEEAFNSFVAEVCVDMGLEEQDLSDISDVYHDEFDGMEQYTIYFVYNNLQIFISTVSYNDADGNIQATVMAYPKGDKTALEQLNVILDSITMA